MRKLRLGSGPDGQPRGNAASGPLALSQMVPDTHLVQKLVSSQFPKWAHLPVRPVEPGGRVNRTFRLGEDLVARSPELRLALARTRGRQARPARRLTQERRRMEPPDDNCS